MRDSTRPLPLRVAARAVFGLTIEALLWSRRSLWMGALLGLPVVVAACVRLGLVGPSPTSLAPLDFYGAVVTYYFVRNVLPLTALFYATALVAEEVEGRTIVYLLTRPIGRGAVLVGKLAAYLATTLSLALPAVALVYLIALSGSGAELARHIPDLLRDLGVTMLTLASYGALFALLGVALRRPAIPGVLFLFVWELLANLPGYVPRLTITAYLRSLLRHRPVGEGLTDHFAQALPVGTSLAALGLVIIVSLALAVAVFTQREYGTEQS